MKPQDRLDGRICRHQAEGGTVGPLLAPTVLIDRLYARMISAEYEEALKAVHELKCEPS